MQVVAPFENPAVVLVLAVLVLVLVLVRLYEHVMMQFLTCPDNALEEV